MTELITEDIWERLTSAAKNAHRPASVAVAYFGKGASKLLPLAAGSRLVVDASEQAVKSGQTHPRDLKRLYDAGARVFSYEHLHAKAFVFDRTAFVGSANASNRSADTLVEAVVATNDAKTVNDTREFVRGMCLNELGPEELDRLQKLYRPPRIPGVHARSRSKKAQRPTPALPRLRLVQLTNEYPPSETEKTKDAGWATAEGRMEEPKRHVIDYFWWQGNCSYKRGDLLLMVTDEGRGRVMVSPPGRVVHQQVWRGVKKYTFTYLEQRNQRRMSLDRLAKQLGYGWKKRLHRNGPLKKELTAELLVAWS